MKRKTKKESAALLLARITKEMTGPRIANSARKVEANRIAARFARPKQLALPQGT
jgi:hypothetical protein